MNGKRSDRILYRPRRGKRLRPARQRLMDELLPRLLVPTGAPLDPGALFPEPKRSYELEIGFGGGEHLADRAAAHPETGFIGVEPFSQGLARLLAEIEAAGLGNIRLFDQDVLLLLPVLPDASMERVYLLFPDPWPKKRHHKRRFVQPGNLDGLARVLKPGGELRFASDHDGYVRWTLAHFLRHPAFDWTARGPDDWLQRPDGEIATRYENKAAREGRRATYLSFVRRAGA